MYGEAKDKPQYHLRERNHWQAHESPFQEYQAGISKNNVFYIG
jgi:hypothetical protein